jgi:hypothetical protein
VRAPSDQDAIVATDNEDPFGAARAEASNLHGATAGA